MQLSRLFFRECSLSKVAATFQDRADAESAAQTLLGLTGMHDRQVQLVQPGDRDWGRKVEPEGVGIWRTAVRAHLTCGFMGLAAGVLLFAAFYVAGVQAVLTTPGMGIVAVAMFGAMFGLMLGGALTLRPDHGAVIAAVQRAMASGMWSVVAHPATRSQMADAEVLLARTGAPIARTL